MEEKCAAAQKGQQESKRRQGTDSIQNKTPSQMVSIKTLDAQCRADLSKLNQSSDASLKTARAALHQARIQKERKKK